MTIGDKIRSIRGELSQREFAERLAISIAAVSMYENNMRVPRDELKKKIADYAGKTVQEIFFDE